MIVNASVSIDTSDLTNEQIERLVHHVDISRRVFTASVQGMAKGVRKYGPEPAWNCPQIPEYDLKSGANEVASFLAPAHIQRGGRLCQSRPELIRRCPGGGTMTDRQLTLDEVRSDGLCPGQVLCLRAWPMGE